MWIGLKSHSDEVFIHGKRPGKKGNSVHFRTCFSLENTHICASADTGEPVLKGCLRKGSVRHLDIRPDDVPWFDWSAVHTISMDRKEARRAFCLLQPAHAQRIDDDNRDSNRDIPSVDTAYRAALSHTFREEFRWLIFTSEFQVPYQPDREQRVSCSDCCVRVHAERLQQSRDNTCLHCWIPRKLDTNLHERSQGDKRPFFQV